MANILKNIVFFVISIGCSSDQGSTYYAEDTFPVNGFLTLGTSQRHDFSNLYLNLIDADGHRNLTQWHLNPATGTFQFDISLNQLIKQLSHQPPIVWGYSDENLPDEGSFAKRLAGALRFEIVAKGAFSGLGNITYLQSLLQMTQSQSLVPNQKIDLSQEDLGLGLAGRIQVEVFDRDDKPIANADVTALAYEAGQPITVFTDSQYGSVFSKTDANGSAIVFPVPTTGLEPGFQVMASAEGYCPFMGPLTIYTPSQPNRISIRLENCQNFGKGLAPEFFLSFGDGIKTQLNSQYDLLEGYVNSSQARLRVNPQSNYLRGYRIFVYEGFEAEGAIQTELTVSQFTSDITINLPTSFRSGKSQDGSFRIGVQSLYSENDRRLYGTAPFKWLIGIKSTALPSIRKDEIVIQSSVGIENVISGKKDHSFVIKWPKCPEQGELGFLRDNETVFFECREEISIKNATDFVVDGRFGGIKEIIFFVKDRYGNISADDLTEKSNRKQVFLDYGVPDLESQKVFLGANFGIAPTGVPAGSDDDPYVFELGTVISRATLSDFVFRFTSPSQCKHSQPSLEDGSEQGSGHLIEGFAVTSDQQTRTHELTYFPCTDDIPLDSSTFVFPESAADPAIFYLSIRDHAGHVSEPFAYEIQPCLNDTSNKVFCWQ